MVPAALPWALGELSSGPLKSQGFSHSNIHRACGLGVRGTRLPCARSEEADADEAHKDRATLSGNTPLLAPPGGLEFAQHVSPTVGVVKRSSLRGGPLACGVKTATSKFDLPRPQVAVRNLVEQAQFAHLCTIMSNMHHRRSGYPFGTLVGFTTDGEGYPVFTLSPLAIPTQNILEDSRCSLVVQMPGWTGLANARVTIFGDVYQLPPKMSPMVRELFEPRNNRQEKFVTGNSLYFRMHDIKDIFFVGGFGTVQWIDVKDYLTSQPDEIVATSTQETLQELNESCKEELQKVFSSEESPVDDAAIISIDALGVDVRIRAGAEFGVLRMAFDTKVSNVYEAIQAVKKTVMESAT